MGVEPFLVFRSKGRRIEVQRRGAEADELEGDPFEVLRALLRQHRAPRPAGAPPFFGGAVGYFGYDLRHHIEECSAIAVDDCPVPDCYLGFYDAVIGVDHHEGEAYVCTVGENAEERAERLEGTVAEAGAAPEPSEGAPIGGEPQSNFTRAEYVAAVERTKEYIAAGDIIQANLSQRFSAPLSTDPFDVYLRLRGANPAPFAAWLDCGDVCVASSSPELFLRVEGREVMTRPIKGTRPRGRTEAEDAALRRELVESEKDRAELLMITDLERNDLGRVCEYGSVRVPQLFTAETYATVHHLVATVTGSLREGVDCAELLRASFPGGSITGAPKIRAMEIIDELEPTRRGVYTGAIGYIGFDGSMELNIAIRTLVMREDMVHFQVGGGIVADSDPEAEYEETLDKAKGLMEALGA
jgi:para-aminobenzoate synthetase component 1